MDELLLKDYIRKNAEDYYSDGCLHSHFLFKLMEKLFEYLNPDDVKMYLFDEEHFTKSKDSFIRSVTQKVFAYKSQYDEDNVESDYFANIVIDTLSNFKDFFRMNFCILHDELFEAKVVDILKKLMAIDNITTKYPDKNRSYKNSFNDCNGCKDLKVYLSYKDRYPIEVQFHNKSSEDINLSTHGIYEVYRANDLKKEYKNKLGKDRIALYNLVISPRFDEQRIIDEGLGK